MARDIIEFSRNQIVTSPVLALPSDFKGVNGEGRYIPAQPGDAPNVWPVGYQGFALTNDVVVAVKAGEQIHIKSLSPNFKVEYHENGA